MNCSYPPHFTMESELKEARAQLEQESNRRRVLHEALDWLVQRLDESCDPDPVWKKELDVARRVLMKEDTKP